MKEVGWLMLLASLGAILLALIWGSGGLVPGAVIGFIAGVIAMIVYSEKEDKCQ
jgi:hypothetical protein